MQSRRFFLLLGLVWSLASGLLAHPLVFVANRTSGDVSVIDAATNTVIATVPVGNDPSQVVVANDGSRAFVAVSDDSCIAVIATSTLTKLECIPTSGQVESLAINLNGTRVWGSINGPFQVDVVDTVASSVVDSFGTREGRPLDFALSPDGTTLYVTTVAGGSVEAFDTSSHSSLGSDTGTGNSFGIVVSPDGSRLFVANGTNGTASVWDAGPPPEVLDIVPLGFHPGDVAVHPGGSRFYISGGGSEGTVWVLDATQNPAAVEATVAVGNGAGGLAITPDGRYLYVTTGGNQVAVIETATNVVTTMIPVGQGPAGIAISPFILNAAINIKPGSYPNSINTCSGGATPVIIWGSDSLNVRTIDVDQLVLASAHVKTVGKSDRVLCSFGDEGSPDASASDQMGVEDGIEDMTCHFITIELTNLEDTSPGADLSITGCENPNGGCSAGDLGFFQVTATDKVNIVKDCDP